MSNSSSYFSALRAEWRERKDEAERDARRRGDHEYANALAACSLFSTVNSAKELCENFFRNPQSREFCFRYQFPSLETFRSLQKKYDLTEYGVFVDRREVASNLPYTAVIGRTKATILAETQNVSSLRVYALYGARLHVVARHYNVVFVYAMEGCEVTQEKDAGAIISIHYEQPTPRP